MPRIEDKKVRKWVINKQDKPAEDRRKFYSSAPWRRLRKRYVSDKIVCEFCDTRDKTTIGRTVHHIIPILTDMEKALDENNLIFLCPECHELFHKQLQKNKIYNKITTMFELCRVKIIQGRFYK